MQQTTDLLETIESPEEQVSRFRFGIGEWYGQSFLKLTATERLAAAKFDPASAFKLKKVDRERLHHLQAKRATVGLTPKEEFRLSQLQNLREREILENRLCPFKLDVLGDCAPCSKKGGVCSLRLYESTDKEAAKPVSGNRGALRAVCPARFHEKGTAFQWASTVILGTPKPFLVGEVGFLESSESVDGLEGEDVGRIDMVMVDQSKPKDYPMQWLALEIQAVYFSGVEMGKLFKEISNDVEMGGSGLVFPGDVRRPDYRSSGPKRLMPQLQIKVPTLRRWGKKMAIVVDQAFYYSMGLGEVETVVDVSNADIAWFVVDFEEDASSGMISLKQSETFYMTLEEAVKGLTGGTPVTIGQFESRISAKINL